MGKSEKLTFNLHQITENVKAVITSIRVICFKSVF